MISCCGALAVKRTSTSSATKLPLTVTAAATLGAPPPAPPPPPAPGLPGGGRFTLITPVGGEGVIGVIGNLTRIGGLWRGGCRGGRSPLLPGGSRTMREPSFCDVVVQVGLVVRPGVRMVETLLVVAALKWGPPLPRSIIAPDGWAPSAS